MAFYNSARIRFLHQTLANRVTPLSARLLKFTANRCILVSQSRNLSTTEPSSVVLYDSLSESYKTLPVTSENKGLAFYTCGPTTYAPAHLGHARTYVCLDILRRVLEHHSSKLEASYNSKKLPPLFVMNITDVDDKIFAAAAESKDESPVDLARRFETDFWRDLDALGCKRPHVVTRVTDHVESDIVPYIDRLVQQDMAYVVQDDGVYFDVRAFESKLGHLTKYGKLAPPANSSDFFSLRGVEEAEKRDVRDFVLWKNRKPGEDLYWESPWGQGRPGWHIECSAMIESVQKRFQNTHEFKIHAGGVDLKFPHHTNEIAQAEAYAGTSNRDEKEWIQHWIHTGHLHIHGMKMSKSLKNFITIQEMLSSDGGNDLDDGAMPSSPADDFRLWCLGLSGSYRGPATYSQDRLDESRVIREKLVRFLLDGSSWIQRENENAPKTWSDNDYKLFTVVSEATTNCHCALAGTTSNESEGQTRQFDMDGSLFLEELLRIVDAGDSQLKNSAPGESPVEPIRAAVDAVRDLLSLVGFSDSTVRVGLSKSNGEKREVVGGGNALIEELVQFRAAVRKAAHSEVKSGNATDGVKDILGLCDHLRKDVMPTMGLELLDSKIDDDSASPGWRYIVPKTKAPEHGSSTKSAEGSKKNATIPINEIPVEKLFRTGPYEGMFSEYDDNGIPVKNADGTEISKRLMKKLLKKRDKHIKRRQEVS